ncbi:potassium voltage-gated channel subfamily H member 8 [Lates japonicus]|uniref:Potassium voltage-gated channel subfamily H member 8 n=1 Tax=Lates japonicus TaxID=270547 RepID=A0AAD3MPK5_LATJO|nr:potassium voltage-gated channel subfamily H member 8 [Lates japonicus]
MVGIIMSCEHPGKVADLGPVCEENGSFGDLLSSVPPPPVDAQRTTGGAPHVPAPLTLTQSYPSPSQTASIWTDTPMSALLPPHSPLQLILYALDPITQTQDLSWGTS